MQQRNFAFRIDFLVQSTLNNTDATGKFLMLHRRERERKDVNTQPHSENYFCFLNVAFRGKTDVHSASLGND